MTFLRGFAAPTSKSMDELVKGFFNNSLTNDEYRQLYQTAKQSKKYPSIYKYPDAVKSSDDDKVGHVVLTDYSGSIVFESGLTLTMKKNGDMCASYDGKDVEIGEDLIIKIPANYLAHIYNHVIKLHKLDNAIAQSEIMEQKTRYIHTQNKRAFIAGMLTGQKLTKP